MYSLKSYTEQCYNIGSPKPSPSRHPFQELPASKDTSQFDFSPISEQTVSPIKISVTTRKRKLEHSTSDPEPESFSSPKKARKMNKKDKEEFMKFIAEQSRISSDAISSNLQKTFDSRMDTLESQIKTISAETKAEISGLGSQLKDIRDSTEAKLSNIQDEFGRLQTMVTETANNNLEELKETLVPIIKDDVVRSVRSEMKSEFNAVDAIWKSNLSDKVWEAEHNLLIFNHNPSKAPIEDAKEFLEKELNLNADSLNKIELKRALRLGKGKNNKPPPLLLKFSHPSDRNHVLSHSKNLKDKPYKIEKDVPKLYKKMHGDFKEESWKLREQFEYQTQISFIGHLMVLQFKSKSTDGNKYHYINHLEWFPPPCEAISQQKSSSHVPPGTTATPVISPVARARAESSIFMTGMKTELSSDLLATKFGEMLKAEHRELVVDICLKKKHLAIIYCDSWESCVKIATSYNEFNGEKVVLKMFAKEKPKPATI